MKNYIKYEWSQYPNNNAEITRLAIKVRLYQTVHKIQILNVKSQTGF